MGKLRNFQVVVLEGAACVGKTVAARRVCELMDGRYLTLADPHTRRMLAENPRLVGDGSQLTVVDEIRMMPELAPAVTTHADERGDNGLFLITGTGDRTRTKATFKELGCRKASLHMRPCSQHEINADLQPEAEPEEHGEEPTGSGNLIDAVIEGRSPPQKLEPVSLEKAVATGGYPRVHARASGNMKGIKEEYIFEEIVVAALHKSKVAGMNSRRRLLTKLSGSIGQQRNYSELAKEIGGSDRIAGLVHDFLDSSHLIEQLPNLRAPLRGRKLSGKCKLHVNDSGLATTMLQLDAESLRSSPCWGRLLENFVLSELRKHRELSSASLESEFRYYGEKNGIEVGIVLDLGTELIAFEVSDSNEPHPRYRKDLVEFKRLAGNRCRRAILFHGGYETVRFRDGTEAWPIASLVRPWLRECNAA